ncbi:hypothetical protein B0H19DRAFT_1265007 [Mycena capillaripes]|nr:hypothetical protein B0H19DRAFT_1265007 [Mycena capillaripes]
MNQSVVEHIYRRPRLNCLSIVTFRSKLTFSPTGETRTFGDLQNLQIQYAPVEATIRLLDLYRQVPLQSFEIIEVDSTSREPVLQHTLAGVSDSAITGPLVVAQFIAGMFAALRKIFTRREGHESDDPHKDELSAMPFSKLLQLRAWLDSAQVSTDARMLLDYFYHLYTPCPSPRKFTGLRT